MADNPESGEMFDLLTFGSGRAAGSNFRSNFLKEHHNYHHYVSSMVASSKVLQEESPKE